MSSHSTSNVNAGPLPSDPTQSTSHVFGYPIPMSSRAERDTTPDGTDERMDQTPESPLAGRSGGGTVLPQTPSRGRRTYILSARDLLKSQRIDFKKTFGDAPPEKVTPKKAPKAALVDPQNPALQVPKEPGQEDLIAAFRAMYHGQEEDAFVGAVTFPRPAHPRCLSSRGLWAPYLQDRDTVLLLDACKKQGNHFIWAVAYKTMEMTSRDHQHLSTALDLIETEEVLQGFKAESYRLITPPTATMGALIVAQDEASARLLLNHRIFTARTKEKSATYFLQNDVSWGSHIIVDIYNGGRDFKKDVLPRFYRKFKDAIRTPEEHPPGYVSFTDLTYSQVQWNPKTHKGAKGLIWRVKFRYSTAALSPTWTIPRSLGVGRRGVIEVKRPPLCSHCISHSHAQSNCQWWKEGLVADSKTEPKGQLEPEWTSIAAAKEKVLEGK